MLDLMNVIRLNTFYGKSNKAARRLQSFFCAEDVTKLEIEHCVAPGHI